MKNGWISYVLPIPFIGNSYFHTDKTRERNTPSLSSKNKFAHSEKLEANRRGGCDGLKRNKNSRG
ncbi:MAG: hypothetical protein V2G48_00405 [bacterium JZ-2024 1]